MKNLIIFIGLIFSTIFSFAQMKVTSGDVNFRTSPEITENKISVIPKGTLITIEDSVTYKNWTRINYGGESGYVNNNFLTNTTPDSKKQNYSNNTSINGVKYYKNSKGEKVQSPTHYDSAPPGATAECNDGTYSFSKSRRGTCSHHGGVKRWLK